MRIKTPYGHNTDIQSLRAGFCGGGGNVTALVENGGLWWTWIIVDVDYSGRGL
jgi:hypothetical protein